MVIEIHNVVLSRAAELGLIFAALFVALLAIGPGRNLWSAPRAELHPWRLIAAASFSAWFGAAMFGPLAIPFANLATFLICGIPAAGYLTVPRGRDARTASPQPVSVSAPRSQPRTS